ncbi:tRNA adenosine(34) deaminase TadA [Hydrogenovibrio sp. JE_KL2]|uniref:tRNA adenosine(34) deaminase TadA n=1 Tax=Hydrogenovibrio sp. JE_KL2 TaxID=2651188 RepID=UPI0021103551|nr:tRNA adenosine(34) deaminase TadA [Hydrogenovibrio sp. JE_KL2]
MSDSLEQDIFWMHRALELAKIAESQGEVPVGAVLVDDNGLVAEGWNQTIQLHDPTAHAEVVALRNAGQKIENYRMPGLTLYVTLEPCPMCAGALVHGRISRLVIATEDPRTGAAGSLMNLVQHPELNHEVEVQFGVLKDEASQLIKHFFKQKRAAAKAEKQINKNE